MYTSMLQYYKAINDIQVANANATSFEEALRGGVTAIAKNKSVASAVIWTADKAGDGRLHPCYWIGSEDLMTCSYVPDEGAVGRAYETNMTLRLLEFDAKSEPQSAADFPNTDITSMVCVPFSNNYET